jgi:hypothetical protein
VVLNMFLRVLSLLIRVKCPAHASLFALIWLTIFESLNSTYNSCLYHFRHVPFSSFAPKTHRSTLHSNRPNRRSLVLDRVHVSDAYVNKGLISTSYINVLVFFEVKWDLRCFLGLWKHLFARRIRFWISSLMSLLQLTLDPK